MSKELATTNGQNKPKQRRPRKSQQMSVNAAAGDNTKYLANALSMWDWQKPDMTDPVAVNARIKEYFQLCINGVGQQYRLGSYARRSTQPYKTGV